MSGTADPVRADPQGEEEGWDGVSFCHLFQQIFPRHSESRTARISEANPPLCFPC